MDFGSRWKIATSFGWVHLSRHGSGDVPPEARPGDSARARFLLRFELERETAPQAALLELAALLAGEPASRVGFMPDKPSAEQIAELARLLDRELDAKRVSLSFEPFAGVLRERERLTLDFPLPSPATRVGPETSFIALRLVDQKGAPVIGRKFKIELPDKSVHRGRTNNDGFGRVAGFTEDGTAKITFSGLDELDFKTRHASTRLVIPVGEDAAAEEEDEAADGPSPLIDAPETEDLPRGQLFLQLLDKRGRVRHADRTFKITGPQSFEGKTDEEGRLRFEDVEIGDYSLSLALDFFMNDPDATVDIIDLPLVVLEKDATEPQIRMVGAVPRSILASLHMFFNTNKTFLLPTALPSMLKLRSLYAENSPCNLLVVGHADTRGGTKFNDDLSLARAEATIAFLKDDVDAWFKFYSDQDERRCWGKVEDHLMIISMPDFVDKPKGEDEVRFYQRTRKLKKVDGIPGEETRKALIKEYMSLDGASLSDFVGEIEAVAHGCGEHFPLDDSGQNLDENPQDQKRDQGDRRVELFFFDPAFGITPPPPGPSSKAESPEYPLWRQRVEAVVDLEAGDLDGPKVVFVEFSDAHFRTDSAVVLPEGENPDQRGDHEAFTSVGLIATALRFNQEHSERSVLVAGHTDTSAGDQLNQELSELRARVALALLKGDRDSFAKLCNERHEQADVRQILSWVSRAFEDLTFDCDPGPIIEAENRPAVRKFQIAYNANKSALGATAPDLLVDGGAGEATFGAFFDCYEHALRLELGEDAAGLAALRAAITFADPQRESLGFGEKFPIEELGVDQFRSQSNRRVEIVFFQPGEVPDLARAQDDPTTSELYLPGHFARASLPPMVSAKPFKATWGGPPPAQFGQIRKMLVDAPGVTEDLTATFTVEQLVDGVVKGGSATIAVATAVDSISADFGGWFTEELVVRAGAMQATDSYPKVSFRYTVECGGRLVSSVELPYADTMRMRLLVDAEGPPAEDAEFTLHSPWGVRPGKTDDQGRIDIDDLPPGGAHVVFSSRLISVAGDPEVGGEPAPLPPQIQLEMTLVDAAFQPREDVPYTVIVDEFTFLEQRTKADGRISESINADAQSVRLQFDEAEVALDITGLPPPQDIAGVQRRLNNLGYDTGALATAINPAIEAALRAFRRDRNLAPPAAGQSALDDEARSELVTVHGS